MSWKKLTPVVVALLLALPTVVVLSPASAQQAPQGPTQEFVPIAPTVAWVPQVGHVHKLYLRFPDSELGDGQPSGQPNCAGAPSGGGTWDFAYEPAPQNAGTPRTSCAFFAAAPTANAAELTFQTSSNLVREFNVTGNRSLVVRLAGEFPDGATMNAQLASGGSSLSTAVPVNAPGGSDTASELTIAFQLNDNGVSRFKFNKDARVTLTLQLTVPSSGNLVDVQTWRLSDTGSHLEITSADALRAATWSLDERGNLRNVFRPQPADAPVPQTGLPLIVGAFAVDSAFGYDDARLGGLPRFALVRDSVAWPVGPNGDGVVPAQLNASLSHPALGRAVWTFDAGWLDYRGLAPGDVELRVTKNYRQGSTLAYGNTHQMAITSQSVRIGPFAGETLAHEVQAGGTTTYVIVINNTGSANDTFRLNVVRVPGSGQWSASIGGPNVLNREIRLAPDEEKFLTLTVTAPADGAPGDSSVFILEANSTRDPTAEKQQVTVATRIGTTNTREVDVLLPREHVLIDPAIGLDFPIYGWNKGTRVANLTLAIVGAPDAGWSIDFIQAGTLSKEVVLPGVRPGDLSEAVLRVQGPLNQRDTHPVTINVTLSDAQGVAKDRVVTFELVPRASVKLDILDRIGGVGHVVELSTCMDDGGDGGDDPGVPGLPGGGGGGATGGDCEDQDDQDNGVDGAWFRVWVTNTGSVADEFILTIDSTGGCDNPENVPDPFIPKDPVNGDFAIYFRSPTGARSGQSNIQLGPGDTGELYVWRKIDKMASPCAVGNPFQFVVNAEGRETKAVARAVARVDARNDGGQRAVLLEGVERKGDYRADAPLIDTSQADKRTVTDGVQVGRNTTYYVRVTNGASFATYRTDGNGPVQSSNVTVRALFDSADGWNVSIRPRYGDAFLGTDVNPYRDTLYFSNVIENRAQAWVDHEIEVVVQPPKNKTLIAGESYSFVLQGLINGSEDTSTLTIRSIVTQFANVSVEADRTTAFAHPGEAGAYLLTVYNNGSTEAPVNLRASMNPDNTPDRGLGWSVVLSANDFTLPANTNRTVALLVTPPSGAVQGAVGEINVSWEYPRHALTNELVLNSTRLFTEVWPQDSLNLDASVTSVTVSPSSRERQAYANFTFTLTSSRQVDYVLNASAIPNWTSLLDGLNPAQRTVTGSIGPGQSKTVTLVLEVPTNVINGSTFSSIVRVEEVGNDKNFDSVPVSINIQGGRPIASLAVPTAQKTVDRGQARDFEVHVKNLGNAAGRIALEVRTADPLWSATIGGVNDSSNPYVDLGPNQLRAINVTVRAPLQVPENTVVPVEVIAHAPNREQTARAIIQARVHDYGLSLTLDPAGVDLVAGTATEVKLKLRNRGNDNDTLNVSHIPNPDFEGWTVEIPIDRVLLEPGAERELRATIRSPTDQLPTARTYNFKFYAGTLGGAAVNFSKNDTSTAAVTVLRYVAVDVDRDDSPEIAVDLDKRVGNGYEEFREIDGTGLQTEVVEATLLDGKTRFLLDVPTDRHDGIADVWFDPENVYAYPIPAAQAFDVTGDRAPDYLLDTDRDGKIDKAYDTDSDRYLEAKEIKTYGDDRIQYLIDTTGTGTFTRFYDPEARVVTQTQAVRGQPDSIIGLDTDDDKSVDKYYDASTGRVSDAKVANFADFAKEYWYFFVAFAAMVLVTTLLVVKRRRGGD